MLKPTPFDFFAAFYPDPIRPGQLGLRTRTHRGGVEHTYWCRCLREVARLVHKYRRTRDLSFSPPLHNPQQALAIARQRRKRATLGMVRGIEASVTAVPALWAEVPVAGPGRPGSLPPDRRAALGLLSAVPRPSIVAETPRGLFFCWLLRRLWVLESAAERRPAKALLRRVQWALESAAAERGWMLPPDGDLARRFEVPAELRRFPLAPGEDRYRRRDFAGLAAAPPIDRSAWPAPREEPPELADVRRVRAGCPWLDACFEASATLERKKYRAAMTILVYCGAPGAGPYDLAHELSRRHPGYDEIATSDELRRAQRDPRSPRTCRYIAHHLDALDDYCRACPSYGKIESPLDLGRPPDAAVTRERSALPESSPSRGSDSPPSPPTPEARLRELLAEHPDLVLLQGGATAPGRRLPAAEDCVADGSLGALLAGLRTLLPRLGGIASARQLVDALRRGEARDLPLRRALERLFAHRGRGGLPSPRLLAHGLRALAGHAAGGLILVPGPRARTGVVWSVRRAPAAAGAEPLMTQGAA